MSHETHDLTPLPWDERTWPEGIPWDPEIARYLRDIPGELGEASTHPSPTAGASGSIASSDPYHTSLIDRIPSAVFAARCDHTWQRLTPYARLILSSHYHSRRYWPQGTEAHLGSALVGVALGTPPAKSKEMLDEEARNAKLNSSFRRFGVDPIEVSRQPSENWWTRDHLLEACKSATKPNSKEIIESAKGRAISDLIWAHGQWSRIYREVVVQSATERRLARFRRALSA